MHKDANGKMKEVESTGLWQSKERIVMMVSLVNLFQFEMQTCRSYPEFHLELWCSGVQMWHRVSRVSLSQA